jgi:hypothetical protein
LLIKSNILKFTPKNRIKNFFFAQAVANENLVKTYIKDQFKKHSDQREVVSQIIPLFIGTPKGDFRDDNTFLPLKDFYF